MTDLFHPPATIEAHGRIYDLRPLEDEPVTETTFAKFWAAIPVNRKNGSKPNAEKQWYKLTPQEQALAFERVAVFYTLTPEERLGAQALHVSRFLKDRNFNEDVVTEKLNRREAQASHDPLAMAERNIKSGKRFLCTHITSTTARALIAADRVTQEQCRDVGVL